MKKFLLMVTISLLTISIFSFSVMAANDELPQMRANACPQCNGGGLVEREPMGRGGSIIRPNRRPPKASRFWGPRTSPGHLFRVNIAALALPRRRPLSSVSAVNSKREASVAPPSAVKTGKKSCDEQRWWRGFLVTPLADARWWKWGLNAVFTPTLLPAASVMSTFILILTVSGGNWPNDMAPLS